MIGLRARRLPFHGLSTEHSANDIEGERLVVVEEDAFSLMDEWGPEKVVCVSDP